MSITAKELAKMLGLSEAAISMALNHKPGVSTATRKRVLQAANEQGFDFTKIHEYAGKEEQGSIYFLIYKKNGAIVGDTPFFLQLAEGLDLGCKSFHYKLNITYLYDEDDIPSLLRTMELNGGKGFILLGTEMSEYTFQKFKNVSIPFLVLDTFFDSYHCNYVLIDNIQGAYDATQALINKYKVQPGYLRSSYPIGNFTQRSEGFYKAVRRNGMSSSKSVVHHLSPSMEAAYADMRELLEQNETLARCYFADNDLIAAGAMKAMKEFGYEIPDDIAVIGFDDMPICKYFDPPISTIQVPKQEMGELAIKQLMQYIHNPLACHTKLEVGIRLVKRKSF